MSKAKNLGAGVSFAQARPISARRAAIGAATDAPTVGVPDPTELPLNLISQNPDNPREELRDLDGLADSIREIGLVNAITVATIEAYLAARPERAESIDVGARYIVVDGHRRLEATRRAGAQAIRVSVNNNLVATDEALLEAAFVANVHRDDMNPIEQAHALEKLVEFYGSQNKAAKRLGIGQSTISSKLSILELAPALQADLIEGRRTIEHVRNLSKLTPEEQQAKADARAAAAEEKATPKRELSRRDSSPADESASSTRASQRNETAADLSRRDNPSSAQDSTRTAGDDLPAQRNGADLQEGASQSVFVQPPAGASPDRFKDGEVPWYDGAALMDTAFDRLDPTQRSEFILRYFQRSHGLEAVITDMRGTLPPEARSSLAAILQQVSAGLLKDA
ncbi:ParB/RepB/Spo0J family partition protein [Streptomyces sp. SR27]|uniref:ParB/RepB/Spo0J family partition protein n=1 Tax=Streptomyces sp. SR27 TaxID=3076630 RepID=UPI00295AA109|nr:ParB/RepB/Spo0J family partition protein [Streptomyces sp. SR27]MDV9190018.1 ParB/RepB/Spo0J family partition protein [Streptomyces sp. SR27]